MQREEAAYVEASALISDCERYRYRLLRTWDLDRPRVLWIMLNPSSADGRKDDPTMRRVVGFSKLWGFGGAYVGNLFGFRDKEPRALLRAIDPVGPHNDEHILGMLRPVDMVVFGWGSAGGNTKLLSKIRERMQVVQGLVEEFGHEVYCIGYTDNERMPRHPLMARYCDPVLWTP